MNISSASASAVGLNFAQTMQLRAAAKQADEARKSEIQADKGKVMDTPAFKGAESKKQQAKAKIQQLMEWLKIVRKLYASDPKGMAKALAQVFKDLKAAVKLYRDAGGDEMKASGAAASAVMAPAAAPSAPADEAKTEETPSGEAEPDATGETPPADGQAAADPQAPATAEPDKPAANGPDLYKAVVDEVKKSVGEDGLDFIKQVRQVANKIVELLDSARIQAAVKKRDKDMDKAFEDAGKALKDLREEIDGMEQDIHHDAPMAGMKLSVAA